LCDFLKTDLSCNRFFKILATPPFLGKFYTKIEKSEGEISRSS